MNIPCQGHNRTPKDPSLLLIILSMIIWAYWKSMKKIHEQDNPNGSNWEFWNWITDDRFTDLFGILMSEQNNHFMEAYWLLSDIPMGIGAYDTRSSIDCAIICHRHPRCSNYEFLPQSKANCVMYVNTNVARYSSAWHAIAERHLHFERKRLP